MRNKLLATVAVAAVVGFGGFAAAQSQMGGESNKGTSGATSTQQKSGAGTSGTESGSKTLNPSSTQSSNPSRNQSAQEKSGKDNERLGQGRNEEQKGMTRGAQDQKGMQQKGAQQERGLQKDQKGAQQERGTNLKGAQQERGNLKGAQEERGERGNLKGAQDQRGTNMKGAQEKGGNATERNATEQNGRTGVNVGERGEHGGSVQLSEGQRSQIKTVIGRGSGPRLSRSEASFDISVGTRVPRSVHFVTLPSEIVRIVPQYRGFDYFLVEDEIVIVDPHTLEIVAVIPA
ncbi:MAG: DUF1236 domain-containing protein [Rhizobiales bacterium]|nr:DUF1236 domain-containing protein [Hyphomicrobiales bacterium]